jgi:outer membrane lipoprotein-sorting protein
MRSKERHGAGIGRLTRRAWLAGRLAILAVCAALVATSTAQPPRPAAPGDPKAIIDHVDRLLRGESSDGEMTMSVVTERWKRSLTLRVWSQGTDRALIRVIAPAKEAGTATLKAGGDIWNYLPKIDRVIRVPTSMMMGSWMGSHFTNDDLVKESRLVRDYDVAVSFDGERGSTRVWEFTLTPRPEAAVVWGKVVIEVRQADLMPTWGRYHGEDGALRRTLTFGSYRVLGGRLVPTTMTVVPADKPTESTVVQYTRLRFDVAIPPETFSLAALRQPA